MENPVKRFLETVLLFDRFFSQPQDFHFWGKTSLLSEFKSIKSIKIADKSIMCRIVPPHKNETFMVMFWNTHTQNQRFWWYKLCDWPTI